MRSIGGIIVLLVGAVVGLFVYRTYLTQSQATGAATPAQTINIVGVKNDLVSIAQAERAYQAEHSSIASLDELVSSGEMSMKKSGRDGYTYEIEPSGRRLSRDRALFGRGGGLHELRCRSEHGSSRRTLISRSFPVALSLLRIEIDPPGYRGGARRCILSVRRKIRNVVRRDWRVMRAWWSSRSSKPLPRHFVPGGRFDSYPLRQIFDVRYCFEKMVIAHGDD